MADGNIADVFTIELSAPAGWIKKLTVKEGGTPQKNGIVFISPTGEEINNKRKLDQYLKSHPGGPVGSEFDWGTGDTPRRSARLGEKLRAAVSAPSHSPAKRQKKSNREVSEEKGNADEEGEALAEKEDVGEETKELLEVSTVDTEDPRDGVVITEEASLNKPNVEVGEQKPETEAVPEKVSAPHDVNTESSSIDKKESNGAATSTGDTAIAESNATPSSEVGETKIDEHKHVEVLATDQKGGKAEETTGNQDDSYKNPVDVQVIAPDEVGNADETTANQDNSNTNPADVQVMALDDKVGNADETTANQDNSNTNPADVQVMALDDKVGSEEETIGNQDNSNENPAEQSLRHCPSNR